MIFPGLPAVISFSILSSPFSVICMYRYLYLQVAVFYMFTLRKDPDIASEPFLANLFII